MSIVKVKRKENPFVQIEKSIFSDNSISWAAKGIMGYLLSKPEGWKVNVSDIVNHSPSAENGQKKRGNGEEAIYAMLKELRLQGYAQHESKRNGKGIIVGSEWIVFEEKQPYRAKPDTAEPDAVEPYPAKPDYNNKEVTNNDCSNNNTLSDDSASDNFSLEEKSEAPKSLPPHSAPPPPPPAAKKTVTKPAEPKAGKVHTTPHGSVQLPVGYTTAFAEVFNQVLAERSSQYGLNMPPYNWRAKPEADMREIKSIMEMVAMAITEKRAKEMQAAGAVGRVEITEEGITRGVRLFMQKGFDYLYDIASRTDGQMANFSPAVLRRNFNSIIQFAYQPKVEQKTKVQHQHDATIEYLQQQRATRFERHYGATGTGSEPATDAQAIVAELRTIQI